MTLSWNLKVDELARRAAKISACPLSAKKEPDAVWTDRAHETLAGKETSVTQDKQDLITQVLQENKLKEIMQSLVTQLIHAGLKHRLYWYHVQYFSCWKMLLVTSLGLGHASKSGI